MEIKKLEVLTKYDNKIKKMFEAQIPMRSIERLLYNRFKIVSTEIVGIHIQNIYHDWQKEKPKNI